MEATTTYFEKPGTANTDATLALARKRAEELGIKKIVVASTSGFTAVKAAEALKGFTVIAITHAAGFATFNEQEFTEENRAVFEAAGGIVHTSGHAFGGLQRGLAPDGVKPGPITSYGDIIAMTLRTFGQGMKVVLECATMAADSGLVRMDEEVISIGGTGHGADTAVVIQAGYTHRFFNTRVKEIICKPRL